MQRFNEDWKVADGEVSISLFDKALVKVEVSCIHPVEVFGVRGDQEIPFGSVQVGLRRFKAEGFASLILRAPVSFAYYFLQKRLQKGDPINNDTPPAPPMPQPTNLVQQIQNIMREQHRQARPPVMENSFDVFQDRYTIDEDDHDFEEDIAARLKAENEAPADPPPEPPADPVDPGKKPPEGDE